jgi:hypothetical protein
MHFGVTWCKLRMVRNVRTSVNINKEDMTYLQSLAESQGLPVSAIIRVALKQWINQRKAAKTSQNQQQS